MIDLLQWAAIAALVVWRAGELIYVRRKKRDLFDKIMAKLMG